MNPDFNEIRAYLPDEYPDAILRLVNDTRFNALLEKLSQGLFQQQVSAEQIKAMLLNCHDVLDIDRVLIVPLLLALHKKGTTTLTVDGIDRVSHSQLFLSNHRDIILDAADLALLLEQRDYPRLYMGLGTNLFVDSWVETLVKLSRCFSVIRGGTPRELLIHSKTLSAYIHTIVSEEKALAWLAQREGRAKDSNDLTQPALLKMLSMSPSQTLNSHYQAGTIEALLPLNITPVAISYEYDPCDYLKAAEMQLRRDNPDFQKTSADDYLSMKTGLFGHRGQVHYNITPIVNQDINHILTITDNRQEQFTLLAQTIDRHIHAAYKIYAVNYIALDLRDNSSTFAHLYTPQLKQLFEQYLEDRIQMVNIPNKDHDYIRQRLLEMYSNPLINHLKATEQ